MDKPIRVLHILQRMEAGGIQALLMNMYRNINRDKVQFDFLVHYEENQFYDEEIERLGGRLYKFSVREDFNFIKYWKDLNQFFKEHKEYTIIHTHMYTLGFIYLLAAKKNGVPIRIAHSHEKSSDLDWKFIIKKIMAKLYGKYATDYFACSKDAGNFLFPNKEFTILKNAIKTEDFISQCSSRDEIRKSLNIEGKFVIGHVGRFHPTKNHPFLIDVFYHFQKIKKDSILLLIGSGELENEIRKKIKELKLEDSVCFLGNRRDVHKLYQAMDVFLLPSIAEGLGIVAIEAQAANIPIICSDTIPDEVRITPLVHYLSLNETPKEWAKKIIHVKDESFDIVDIHQKIIDSGYDIRELSKKMEDYYRKKSYKGGSYENFEKLSSK